MADKGLARSPFRAARRTVMLAALGAPIAGKAAPAAGAAGAASPPLYLQEFHAFDGKTADQKLREIADREELRELIARYAHRIAHGLTVADLFTDDGVFIVRIPDRPVSETRGRAALEQLYGRPRDISVSSKPMIHNEIFDIAGDHAKGTCSNEVRVVEKGQSLVGSGYYEDVFRREKGRWRFVVRDAIFYHWVPLAEGWAKGPSAHS